MRQTLLGIFLAREEYGRSLVWQLFKPNPESPPGFAMALPRELLWGRRGHDGAIVPSRGGFKKSQKQMFTHNFSSGVPHGAKDVM